MIKKLAQTLAAFVMLAAVGTAQEQRSCSSLEIKTEAHPDSFFDIYLGVSGTIPNTPGWIIVGLDPGETRWELPGQAIVLGIENIAATPFLGRSDELGNLGRRFQLPSQFALFGFDVQAINVGVTRTRDGVEIEACLSNVSPLLD